MNIGLKGMRYYGAELSNNVLPNFNAIDSFKARLEYLLLDNKLLEEKMTSFVWWQEYHCKMIWAYYYIWEIIIILKSLIQQVYN